MERTLASIQRIDSTEPIEGADFIELVHILGWQCVAKKGEFRAGDLCVYYEIDSYLPLDDARYDFLIKGNSRDNRELGPGILIKTRKFKGKYSQGLALPISEFPEIADHSIGDDVTEVLGVRKWYVPEAQGSMGTIQGNRPCYVPKTDEMRIQSVPELLDEITGKPYYITTKMDGMSMSVWCWGGEVGVASRNKRYADDGKSPMWRLVKDLGLDEKLIADGRNVTIQGEFCGPKIQSNRLGLDGHKWYVFNVFDADHRLLNLADMRDFCKSMGLDMVPVEESGPEFGYTVTNC